MKKTLLTCAVLMAGMHCRSFAQTIHYVMTGATGAGTSWADASGDLQAMINAAAPNDQIWVSAGTYVPNRPANSLSVISLKNKDNAFVLKSGVGVYGGFDGTESVLTARNWAANSTILSGDFNNDDVRDWSGDTLRVLNNSENANHTVLISGEGGSVVLDGFTINGGNANGSGSLTVNGNNIYRAYGGGIYSIASAAVSIRNCSIGGNAARSFGGACFNNTSGLELVNSVIVENLATGIGGGIYNNEGATLQLMNCTVSRNKKYGISNDNAASICTAGINNSIIWGNTGGAISDDGTGLINRGYSLVQGMSAAGSGNIDGSIDPLFSSLSSGDLHLSSMSPCINNGSNGLYNVAPRNLYADKDVEGLNRLTGARIDIGAYESNYMEQLISPVNDTSVKYGAFIKNAATISSGLPLQYVSSDTLVAKVLQDASGWTINTINVGVTMITVSQPGDSSHLPAANETFKLTVAPAKLVVKADPQSKTYGSVDPGFSYSVSGLSFADKANMALTGTLSRDSGEVMGHAYAIRQGSLSVYNPNYVLDSFKLDSLRITMGVQKITWTQSLIAGCDEETEFVIDATTNSGLPLSYSSDNTDVAEVNGNIVTLKKWGVANITITQSGDSNYTAATAVKRQLNYVSGSLVKQHWNDVLFFDNTSGNYTSLQWYKDNQPIPGATGQYYYAPALLNGVYYAIATDKDGNKVQTCPRICDGIVMQAGISVYPNPVKSGTKATVGNTHSDEELKGASLQIKSLTGNVWKQFTTVTKQMEIDMPATPGLYIIELTWDHNRRESVTVLVN